MSMLALLLVALITTAHAVKLYKWVDDDGRVTYQDRPPPRGTGTIEEKNIDPNQNTADSYIPPASALPAAPAPTATHGEHDNDTRARARTESKQRRRIIRGGGSVDGGTVGGVPPPSPPAPPGPPPSVPATAGGS